jgi:hypothetical protein
MDRNVTSRQISEIKDTSGLEDLIRKAAGDEGGKKRGLPPVHLWNPPFCGDLDMEIRADGTWFYLGTPIGRQTLVNLFSSVLRKDEDGHTYLVTPVEKVRIRVIDAHFLGIDLIVSERDGQQVLSFQTNVGETVEVGEEHTLWFEVAGEHDELKPYFHVRGRLEALVNRATMYELIELGEEIEIDGTLMFAVKSGGSIFPIMSVAELNAQI